MATKATSGTGSRTSSRTGTRAGASEAGGGKGAVRPGRVKVATPWGTASLVEELTVPQRSGDRRFSSLVQLLEYGKGEQLVRFAYSTDGIVRRGPVTLRTRDLERLLSELGSCPRLAEALGLAGLGGDA